MVAVQPERYRTVLRWEKPMRWKRTRGGATCAGRKRRALGEYDGPHPRSAVAATSYGGTSEIRRHTIATTLGL